MISLSISTCFQVDIHITLAQTKIHTDIRKYKFTDMLQVDTAMTAVSAGPGKSASQIFFYDWSDNYRRVIKVEDQPSDQNHPSPNDNHPHDAGDEGQGGGSEKGG